MQAPHRATAGLLSVLVCATAGSAQAQDWPQWRGPHRDARASFKAPAAWPESLAQKWKVTVGEGVATPALVGDRLYVFARQGGKEILRCLNAASGDELWKDEYESGGATGPAASFSGPRCSPTVGEGKVVTIGVRGKVSCLDAATGKVLWRKDDFQESVPRFFAASSPIITDGLCLAQLGGNRDGALVAYDLAGGEQKWKWTGDSPAYASLSLMTVDGLKLVIAETERRIVAIRLADGKQVWETPFAVQGMGYNASTPVVEGQVLIFSGSSRGTQAVEFKKDGDGIVAKELWRNPDQSVQFNTPVVKEGFIYGLSQSNELFCIDKQTGQAAWSGAALPAGGGGGGGFGRGGPGGPGGGRGGPGGRGGREGGGGEGGAQANPPPEGNPPPGGGPPGGGPGGRGRGMGGRGGGRGGYGSIVDAGSVLLALTPASELIVFAPSDKQYAEKAKIKVSDTPTYAYPVVSGNRVFIKDQDSVMLLTVE